MEPEEEQPKEFKVTRSIYMPREDWEAIDALMGKLNWSMSKVHQVITRKFLADAGDLHSQAVDLVTFDMGWSPNDPAGISDREDSAA